MMRPKVVSRDIVKPSSNNHKTFHKFSFFDQMAPPIHVPLLFFYNSTKNHEINTQRASRVLKVSLSDALSNYYPLAGKIKDDVTVDCNDEGTLFLEATMECSASEILKNPDDEILKLLFPDGLCFKVSIRTGPVAVQVTYFQEGGMSIGICLCHKVLDMASMCSFINNWASIARIMQQEKPDLVTEVISVSNPSIDSIRDRISSVCPEFNIGSLYPPRDLSARKQELPPLEVERCPSRRLGFDAGKIAKLKEMVADQVPNPTRVEVVTSLLYKSAMSAATKASSSGSSKPAVLQQAMNLRTRIFNPPVPEGSTGNLVGYYAVSISDRNKEVDLGWIVKELRQMKTRYTSSYAKASNPDEMFSLVVESSKALRAYIDGEEGYFCSSWCRFGFYEGGDFGWGKPFLVTSICWDMKNIIVVMDNEEGCDGIQAFITLDENVMNLFELDEQLLEFSCINPSLS